MNLTSLDVKKSQKDTGGFWEVFHVLTKIGTARPGDVASKRTAAHILYFLKKTKAKSSDRIASGAGL